MKQIKQFRYYGTAPNQIHEPYDLTLEQLVSGRAFEGCYPILDLTINGKLGTIFYTNVSPYPVELFNKNFNLNFEKYGLNLNVLQFEKNSLEQHTANDPLTITIIYEDQLGQ